MVLEKSRFDHLDGLNRLTKGVKEAEILDEASQQLKEGMVIKALTPGRA